MRHLSAVSALVLLLVAPALAAPAAEGISSSARESVQKFEYSLFKDGSPSRLFEPRPEAEQRALFEAYFKTLATVDAKRAFLEGLTDVRYVYSVNFVVLADYAAKLLKDEDAAVRADAVRAIAFSRGMCDEGTIHLDGTRVEAHRAAVAALMKDPDEKVRAAAYGCVGVLHDGAYLETLTKALAADASDAVRTGAAGGLLGLAGGGKVPADTRAAALAAVTARLAVEKTPAVVEVLLLFHTDALQDMDTKAYADAVAAKLRDKDHRTTALWALRGLRSTAHAADVAAYVTDPDDRVRTEAAEALSVIAGPEQVPALIQIIAGRDGGWTKFLAVQALKRLEPRDPKAPVRRAADAGDAAAKTALEKWPEP